MSTRTPTCTERRRDRAESCGGEIRPSFIDTASILGVASKGEVIHPAACQECGKTYADTVSVPMTRADLDMVGDRLSASTRKELEAMATERTPGCYDVEITESRASDLASKAANLGLAPLANKVRHELTALTAQRRQRQNLGALADN